MGQDAAITLEQLRFGKFGAAVGKIRPTQGLIQRANHNALAVAVRPFSADDFVDTTIAAPPPLTATIVLDGSQLRFHRDPLTNNYFVISSAGPQVYVIQSWHAAQVLKRRNEFLTTPS